jgi:hypothetical protein
MEKFYNSVVIGVRIERAFVGYLVSVVNIIGMSTGLGPWI